MDKVKGFLVGTAPAAFDNATQKPYILPIIVGILAVIIIVVIVVVVYQYKANRPGYQTLGPIDLFKPASVVVVDRTTTKSLMGGSYTLSFYIKIDAVPDMRNGATPLMSWPGVWNLQYDPANESATFLFTQVPDRRYGADQTYKMTVPGLPLQRWTQVTLTSAGRSVDVYLNGTLAQSVQLDNVPDSAQSSITLTPSLVMGQLAYVQVWSRRFLVGEVGANYTDTSDSQGRPYLGVGFLSALGGFKLPNLFCPSGNCGETSPTAQPSQTWEFPYA
jgi:hypothetical protein